MKRANGPDKLLFSGSVASLGFGPAAVRPRKGMNDFDSAGLSWWDLLRHPEARPHKEGV